MSFQTITYAQAAQALRAGFTKSQENGAPSSIAVLDAGRNLVAFGREPGALLASVEISQYKAFTSASMQCPTEALAESSQPGQVFFGLHVAQSTPFITFGGGIPVYGDDGSVIGAIGVAGGTPDQDAAVAQAAAEALKNASGEV